MSRTQDGYAKIARFMEKYDEFAIFRRFKTLNYQVLLYDQAEIIHLHDSLEKQAQHDATHPERSTYSRDWWILAHGGGKRGREQWRKVRKIRQKLDNYNERLLKQNLLAKHLSEPDKIDLEFFKEWRERPSMGEFPIRGLDMDAWEAENDLGAIKPRSQKLQDPVARWTSNRLVPFIHGLFGEKFKDPESPELGEGLYNYRESCLERTTNILTTVVASLLPLLSSTVLFVMTSDILKLGVIVAFSSCFALALATMTKARRIEVFGATAAFAAVNVVFLTSNTTVTCIQES